MKKIAIVVAAAAFSASVLAIEPHSYTYLEAAWFDRTDGDGDEKIESDGYSLVGSYRTSEGVLFQANYSDAEVDKVWGLSLSGSGVKADLRKYGVMVGGTGQATERTSFWGGVGFDREELKLKASGIGSDKIDIDQWSFGGGVRHTLVDMLEVNAGLRVIHFRADGDSDNDAELSIGARFQPINWISAGVSFARLLDAETDVIKVDARWQF